MSKYYNIEGNKLVKQFSECPKCGPGFFMGKHSDRELCGNCGYTKFKGQKTTRGKKN